MNETQGRFVSLLKQETTVLEDLYGLLMKELVALKDRDSDLITDIAEAKNSKLNKLGMLDKQRQLYLENEEHYNEVHGGNTPFVNEIDKLSSEIQICLDKCKQQNNINGGIIEMSQLFNEKILDIMCGNSDKPTTYSAEGKNNSKNSQHSLARV
jgi:flagellar biosynthesis protein FlgN